MHAVATHAVATHKPFPCLTGHARQRLRQRAIRLTAVEAVIDFGQRRLVRGAEIYMIGWRDVRYYRECGLDLSRFEGIEVVCSHDGAVLTVYRNENKKALRNRGEE